ncbi:unnamed protein product [Bubo scandiacus]
MDFYPAQIEVTWFQNGREETERVVSTDVIPNGDWTYQVLVMLETTPQRGDTYTCQVEHVSLQHPVSQRWLQSDGGRSKMLTGVGGFVLGLIFLALGLGLYVRKKAECQYLNGTERVRFVVGYIHNREQYTHFDSDVGLYVADTPLGEHTAKYWNSQPDILDAERTAVDWFCRKSYEVFTPFITERKGELAGGRRAGRPRGSVPSRGPAPSRSLPVQPKVRVAPVQSSSLPQTDRLACYVTGFYPAQIEVKWFQNGREETERVVSTDVIPNGDWTYQVLVMLETTPQRGDTYTCQVEHVSLQHPVSQRWELQSDGARSKMLTGVGGFVLGLIFLALGLGLYVRKKVSGRGR